MVCNFAKLLALKSLLIVLIYNTFDTQVKEIDMKINGFLPCDFKSTITKLIYERRMSRQKDENGERTYTYRLNKLKLVSIFIN